MADDEPTGSGISQAEIKKAVEDALKGLPGLSALLEAAQNSSKQPAKQDEPPPVAEGGGDKTGSKILSK